MRHIETMLPAESARQLADDSFGTADDRIKSSAYFQSRMGSMHLFFAGVMIVGTLLALLVSLAAAKTITWPLHLFETVAEKIQAGQYNEKIGIIANDEFAHLAGSINRMTDTLFSQMQQNRALIDSIREAVETLSPMSSQLVAIADQQAADSEQQEVAAEEAAAMGRTIANVARRIAENTARITRNSEKTREISLEGQQQLRQTETTLAEISARMRDIVSSMAQLEQQSLEIDEIVQTIKQISGKTNILSINAGIEAIKAGDNGVRFGVVAREIRLLAHDSRQSALRITDNIERIRGSLDTSVIHVEDGEQAVTAGKEVMGQTTEHFEKILNANMNAARELKQIEAIMSHQAETNRQLSEIINQIKKGTQETTAAAGKTHTTLKSLEHLVAQLQSQTLHYS
jgi:methyl-accepting chemotaxis protein